MGKNNRFREDALKYWDIKCEDAWTRFEEAGRENPYLTAKEFCMRDMGCVDLFMRWTPAGIFFPTSGRKSSNLTHF